MFFNDLATVRRLLDAGLDADFSNARGDTPLTIACSKGFLEIVRFLLQHGVRGTHEWQGASLHFRTGGRQVAQLWDRSAACLHSMPRVCRDVRPAQRVSVTSGSMHRSCSLPSPLQPRLASMAISRRPTPLLPSDLKQAFSAKPKVRLTLLRSLQATTGGHGKRGDTALIMAARRGGIHSLLSSLWATPRLSHYSVSLLPSPHLTLPESSRTFRSRQLKVVEYLLREARVPVDEPNRRGSTALMEAARAHAPKVA